MSNKIFDIRKGIPPIIHVLFCVAILVIPLLVMSRNGMGENKYYIGYLIRTSILIFLFYINYLFLIDRFLFKKQFIPYIIINLVLIAGTTLLQNLIFELLIVPDPHVVERMKKLENIPKPPHEMRILSDYVLIILAIGMSVALKVTRRWYSDSINLETIKAAQLEADLKNLRSQLNPHFLFNTLNNANVLVDDAEKSTYILQTLNDLLRYQTQGEAQGEVKLSDDIAFLNDYLSLEKTRRDRFIYTINTEGCDDISIPPLLFIPFIENAIKHNPESDSYIHISFLIKENRLYFKCENSKGKFVYERKVGGIGLKNIRKRLDLLFGKDYTLSLSDEEDKYTVTLEFKI